MPKSLGTVVAVVAVLTSQVGCHTTKVISRARPAGPSFTDRQWFTVGGLVPLSGPPGRECEEGLSFAESRQSGTDWLIHAGLYTAGALIGVVACGGATQGGDPLVGTAVTAACGVGFSQIVPFFLSSRTVEYSCAEGTGSLDYMPSRRGGFRQAPPPPPQDAPTRTP